MWLGLEIIAPGSTNVHPVSAPLMGSYLSTMEEEEEEDCVPVWVYDQSMAIEMEVDVIPFSRVREEEGSKKTS